MKRNLLKELDPGGETVREFALSQSDAEMLCTVAGERGHSATIADLAGCYDRAGLLARIAEALEFPDSIGGNWEALFDGLVDLSWLPAPGHVLMLLNTAELRRDTRGLRYCAIHLPGSGCAVAEARRMAADDRRRAPAETTRT